MAAMADGASWKSKTAKFSLIRAGVVDLGKITLPR